ncbi:MAG: S-layer homology domain-containing protein [Ruminococcaceae bacterium]|nr:S-layer homology domain-containing protein [Oscillospiraceae bacterium]
MKKLFLMLAIVLVAFTMTAFADDGIVWDMTTADNAMWSTGGCYAVTDGGAYLLQSTNNDMQIKTTLADKEFAAAEYPYFGMKYKAKATKPQMALFWTNTTYPGFTDKADALFDLIIDETWAITVVDLREVEKYDGSWAENITSLRLDPINGSDTDTTVIISRMGFFKSEADATAYLEKGANAEPVKEEIVVPDIGNVDLANVKAITFDMTNSTTQAMWTTNGGKSSVGEEGTFFIQSTSGDVRINTTIAEPFSAAEYPFFGMKARIKADSNQAAIFWTNETFPKFTSDADALFGVANKDGEWGITIIDLREKEKYADTWAGTINSIRLDPINASNENTTIEISRMGFFKTAEEAQAWLEEGVGVPEDSLKNAKDVDAYWNFANEEDRQAWFVSGGASHLEAGMYFVQATSTDVMMTVKTGDKKFHAMKYPYFALKYRSVAKNQGAALFWTNSEYPDFTSKADFLFSTINDGKWHDVVLDARIIEKTEGAWNGLIETMRFDPVNPSTTECGMYIAAIGFFESEQAARDYLASVQVAADYDSMSTFREKSQVSYVPGGTLSEGYVKEDYLVKDSTATGNVVMYKDADGTEKIVTLSDVNGKGFITFSPNHAAEYYLGTSGKEYVDTPNHWAKDYIDYTSARKLFGGTSETEFSPDDSMTRGMFVTVLGRLCGADGTTTGMYYDPYIKWSIEKGYADVTDAAAFRPEDSITRLEMAKFINNYLNDCDYSMIKNTYPAFADTAALTDAEKAAVENARAYGIINGKPGNTFDPAGLLTRGETATVMTRLIKAMLGVNISTAYSPDYFKRDRIKVGTKANFDPNQVDDEYLRYVAELGLDWLVVTPSNSSGDVRNKILNFADANGIEVYLDDKAILSDYSSDAEYYLHPSYTGTYVEDEPGTDRMPALAEIANGYLEKTGRHPHVNLLPMYANAAQLKMGAGAAAIEYFDGDPDLYYKHVATWASLSDAKIMSVDIYPLNSDKNKPTYVEYIESINIFARAARDYNKDFVAYIQAVGWNASKREPSEADFRWQVYSMLSFGCKGFVYWHYWVDGMGYKEYGMVNRDGTPTHIYYAAQPTIMEVKKLSDVYCQYKNLGAFNLNCTEKTPYLEMSGAIEFPAINVQSTSPLLVGCFEKKDGTNGKAFTVVNMNDPTWNKTADFTFTLNGYTTATAYVKGEPVALTATDGVFSMTLENGQGVFVTIE